VGGCSRAARDPSPTPFQGGFTVSAPLTRIGPIDQSQIVGSIKVIWRGRITHISDYGGL
jgi:hypothetical protein